MITFWHLRTRCHLISALLLASSLVSISLGTSAGIAAKTAADDTGTDTAATEQITLSTAITEFLQQHYGDLGDEIRVEVVPSQQIDKPCADPAFFLNQKNLGKTGKVMLRVGCAKDERQRFFVQARVSVFGHYLRTTRKVIADSPIEADMVERAFGDITSVAAEGVVEADEVVGKLARYTLSNNKVITRRYLKQSSLVQRGEMVRFRIGGSGFQISGKAVAMEDANPGDQVRIKAPMDRIMVGVLTAKGMVSVAL